LGTCRKVRTLPSLRKRELQPRGGGKYCERGGKRGGGEKKSEASTAPRWWKKEAGVYFLQLKAPYVLLKSIRQSRHRGASERRGDEKKNGGKK